MELIPCNPTPDCKYWDSGCHESVHHKLWPRRDYRGSVETGFRELDINKVRICRAAHDLLHILEQIPDKPHFKDMENAVYERTPAV